MIDTAWRAETAAAGGDNNASVTGTFTMTAWVAPQSEIGLPRQPKSGINAMRGRNNYVIYPAPGHGVYAKPGQKYASDHSCAGIAAGTNGIVVFEHGESLFAPVLVADVKLNESPALSSQYTRTCRRRWRDVFPHRRDVPPSVAGFGGSAIARAILFFSRAPMLKNMQSRPTSSRKHGDITPGFSGE